MREHLQFLTRLYHIRPLAVALSVTSCADSLAPSATAEHPAEPDAPLLGKPIGEAVSFDQLHLLSHDLLLTSTGGITSNAPGPPSAINVPVLDRYEVTFWAVKGEKKRVTVYYERDDDDKRRFLQFTIPRDGLARRTDGTIIQEGDSVRITLQIDPSNVIASFAPAGLAFTDDAPASSKIWYGGLLDHQRSRDDDDDDDDDDGDDDDDRRHKVILPDFWYRQHAADVWNRLVSEHDRKRRCIKTYVYHFSDYAISW